MKVPDLSLPSICLEYIGQYIALPGDQFVLGLGWDMLGGRTVDLDASVIAFDHSYSQIDTVSFTKLTGIGGAVVHSGDNRTGNLLRLYYQEACESIRFDFKSFQLRSTRNFFGSRIGKFLFAESI